MDSLGDRMKRYEDVTRNYLVPKSYVLLRVDGKAFHSYTKNLTRPFDTALIEDLDNTWLYLCQNIQNTKLGYAQSDEFSLLLTDFDSINTEQYFGGNIQKICSVVASMAAAKFNQLRLKRYVETRSLMPDRPDVQLGVFDCRVWNIPSHIEVYNYYLWRYQDCVRNSLSSVAYANFSHKELNGKNSAAKHEMLMEKGINWSKMDESLKNGRFFVRKEILCKPLNGDKPEPFIRHKWFIEPGFKITENPDKLKNWIPKI